MTKACFTRDSVAAGDDADAPHARDIELPDGLEIDALVRHVCRAAKLPSISGDKATWCLASNIPLAVLAQQWAEPRLLSFRMPKLTDLDWHGQTVRLHFSYLAQQDPDAVFNVLIRLRLTAE